MKPSEVRGEILREHDQLRRMLSEIESLAARVLFGKLIDDAPLRVKLLALAEFLEAHMLKEDELLVPVIVDVDSWGPVRIERMLQHHESQRGLTMELRKLTREGKSAELARSAQALSKTILDDMRQEERELLNPDLLKDDLISIEFLG